MRVGITFHTFDPYLSGVDYYTLGLIRALLRFSTVKVVVLTNAPDIVRQYIAPSPNLHIRSIAISRRIAEHWLKHCPMPLTGSTQKTQPKSPMLPSPHVRLAIA